MIINKVFLYQNCKKRNKNLEVSDFFPIFAADKSLFINAKTKKV